MITRCCGKTNGTYTVPEFHAQNATIRNIRSEEKLENHCKYEYVQYTKVLPIISRLKEIPDISFAVN